MKNVAVILARGGSKGIPNKNIIDLCGKPLIYYTIQASIMSDVDETWVSTDCDKIANISEDYGAKIMMRPEEFSTDISSSEDALIHFCKNTQCRNIVFIQPTSPLLESADINLGLQLMYQYDSVFSGFREHWIPRWRDTGDALEEVGWSRDQRPRRQDRESLVVENGALYITSRQRILQDKIRYGGNIGYVEMPMSRSFQIDTYDDLFIIKSIMKVK